MNVQLLGVVHAILRTINSTAGALAPLGSYWCFDGLITLRASAMACVEGQAVESIKRRVSRWIFHLTEHIDGQPLRITPPEVISICPYACNNYRNIHVIAFPSQPLL